MLEPCDSVSLVNEEVRFQVPLVQRLKFIISLLIHLIGSNKTITQGHTSTDSIARDRQESSNSSLAKTSKSSITIGTAIDSLTDSRKSTIVKDEFNSITPENSLKWGRLLKSSTFGDYCFTAADQIVDYAVKENKGVHGHALVWGKVPGMGYPRDLEEFLKSKKNPRFALQETIENHISTVLGHYKGKIHAWDVVNEPFELSGSKLDNNVFLRHMGVDYIEKSFKYANSVDPSLRLLLNEQFDSYSGNRIGEYLALLNGLLKKSTPVHTIGIQSHIMFQLPSIQHVHIFLRQITNLGLSFEITEFDLRIGLFKYSKNPYQAQADYVKALFEVFFDFKNFLGFTFWSCFDGDNWMDKSMPFSLMKPNSPTLFDLDLSRKPMYYTICDLLEKRNLTKFST